MNLHLFFIIANRNGVFTLGQVPPNDHYNHYLHNEYSGSKERLFKSCSAVREPTSLPSSSRYDLLRAAQQCQ